MLPPVCFYRQPQNQPLIGISACLTGQPVRYDGGHKQQPVITEKLARHARLWPLCPEAGAGLGTPRPPVQLVNIHQQIQVRTVSNGRDVTSTLQHYADHIAQNRPAALHGFIVKSRSPSCGLASTPIHDSQANIAGYGDGLFTRTLKASWTDCFFIDEQMLADETACSDLLLRCYLLQELKDTENTNNMAALLAHYQTHWNNVLNPASWLALLLDPQTPILALLQNNDPQ